MQMHISRFGMVALTAMLVIGISAPAAADKDIVDVASANKDFSTLVAAVKAAELVDTLKGEGPFTVFAPTNEAFEKLGKEKVEALLKDKAGLTKILQAHVVKGKVMAKDAVALDGKMVKPLNGEFAIAASGGKVKIGNANVIKADIEAKNGVIHVIDAVLIP